MEVCKVYFANNITELLVDVKTFIFIMQYVFFSQLFLLSGFSRKTK